MTTPIHISDARSRSMAHSDTCEDAITEFLAFYRSAHHTEYTPRNLQLRARNILLRDHDPSETLHDARQECRYGCTVGTVAFIEEELETILAEATGLHTLESRAEGGNSRIALLQEARDSAEEALTALNDRDFGSTYRSFQRTRDSLTMFRALYPTEAANPEIARVLHATAVAWEMLCCSTGK